jgi:hypothetical protein
VLVLREGVNCGKRKHQFEDMVHPIAACGGLGKRKKIAVAAVELIGSLPGSPPAVTGESLQGRRL